MKKFLAILLTAAMCLLLLAACAPKTNAPDSTTPPASDNTDTPAPAPETPDTPDAPEADDGEADEIAEINYYVLDFMSCSPDDIQLVQDAINAITGPAIGVHVNMTYATPGDYGTMLNMAISGGEQVDLCCVWLAAPANFSGMFSAGQLMDISDYMNEYGQDLLATVGDYLNAYRVNGGLYGVPCFRNYASSTYLIARTDILDELGVTDTFANLQNMDELTAIYKAIKDNYSDIWPGRYIFNMPAAMAWADEDFSHLNTYDGLADNLNVLEASTNGDGKVLITWEQDDTIFNLKKQREWFDAGYVWPDTAITDLAVDEPMKQGIIASYATPSELGVETAKKAATGHDVTCVSLGDQAIATSVVNRFGMGVPVTCKEPVATIKFLNMLYTNEELMTLMDYGIEGTHWEMLDNGEAHYTNDTMTYRLQDFVLGNQFIIAPWQGNGTDFRDRCYAAVSAAPISPYLGFVFDTSELSAEIANLTSVQNEYMNALIGYGFDQQLYDDFMARMYDAGMQTYVDAAQAQLDAWMAANK